MSRTHSRVTGDNQTMSGVGEQREGVTFTHLDEELFDGSSATKRDLVDYVGAMSARLVSSLRNRPLSVVRVRPGQPAFMQKNLPSYTPGWVERVPIWAEASRREISYALANDRRTLLWFANQRAVEYHVTLFRIDHPDRPNYLVLDLDPPEGAAFSVVIQAAKLVHQALAELGLSGAVKTSGAKGVHVFVPLKAPVSHEDAAAATRAVAARAERIDPALATTAFVKDDRVGKVFLDSTRAGGATVVAAYSPRIRPGVPVSFPVAWEDLDGIAPADFTVRTAVALLSDADPWTEHMPEGQRLNADLIAEGHTIPIARVQAMHEGKRRARAARDS
jgi:bifunctional non-homologous end joining protein LigD